MYIRLYYSKNHTPIGAAELYTEISNAEHENICKKFLENFGASANEVCEDKFLIFQDEYIDDFVHDNYKCTIIEIDDNDIVGN